MTWDFRKEINMNINEISVAYLEEKEQRRRASTVDGYRSSINLYILPEFGDSEIETIEPEAIQSWVDSFGKPGAAEKAFKCLSISSANAACVISSYRLDDSQLKINVRNTSGAQITAEVEASILCLKLN